MAKRRRRTVRDEIHGAFERAAVEWKRIAISAIERRLTNDPRLATAVKNITEDARIDLALRHRILHGSLLPRETQILVAAIHGTPRMALGAALGIGENTLKTHINRLMRKLDTATLDQAVIEILRTAFDVMIPTHTPLRASTDATRTCGQKINKTTSNFGAFTDARHLEEADADLRCIGRRIGAEVWAERALAYMAKWKGKSRLVERMTIAATLPQPFGVVDLAQAAGISRERARTILLAGRRRGVVTVEGGRWRLAR